MTNKKGIFIILTPGFAKDEADTTCLPMHQSFIRSLKSLYPNLELIILSFQYPYNKLKYKWFDVEVIPFAGKNKGHVFRHLLRIKIISTLKKIHRRKKIIGILSFWCNECCLIGKKFAEQNNIKHYCWVLGQDATSENKYPKKIKPKPDELVALSDFVQIEFERNHGIRPSFVVPPGIDIKQYPILLQKKEIDILGVGSLIPLKRYDEFLNIVTAVKKIIPEVKVVLIGNGPERKKIELLIEKMKLNPNVSLMGELQHKEVLQWMQRSKILLHTSSYEGYGVAIIEALFAGAHVISFVKPDKSEITNWHVTSDKEKMIEKTCKILKNPLTEYNSICFYKIEDSVIKIMTLFAN
jgi:glycosyltransferase involved in cell wall biosynthesis